MLLVILSPVSVNHDTECKLIDDSSAISCENLLEEVNHLNFICCLAVYHRILFADHTTLVFLVRFIKYSLFGWINDTWYLWRAPVHE